MVGDKMKLTKLKGLEVLDSRSDYTIKVEAIYEETCGTAIVPKGASTGIYEAVELTDNDEKRVNGKGMMKAVKLVEGKIFTAIKDLDFMDQRLIDDTLIKLDGTKSKENLGGNTMLGCSLAIARLSANVCKAPLYRHLGGLHAHTLPMPMFNVLNGGKHANNKIDVQEIMLVPVGAKSFSKAIEMGVVIYKALKANITKQGYSTSLGDEGGFVLPFDTTEEALMFLQETIKTTPFKLGKDFMISFDVAASSFYDEKRKIYLFEGKEKTATGMIDFYEYLTNKFPVLSIEDGLMEDDPYWKELSERLMHKTILVGDDLFVTNKELLKKGIKNKLANALIIKPNQIGTLTETLETIELAQKSHIFTIISHRSGDSEDSFIADLSVAVNSLFIKTGAPARSERTCKYNRLLEIEKELGVGAEFAGNYIRDYLVKK